MKLVFFTHPEFLGNKSMARFAKLLTEGMRKRGHEIETWSPKPIASRMSKKAFIQKWLSYFDLFILFPQKVRQLASRTDRDTLFIFTDQTLGPWVPLVAGRPTVIHCHDFLALRSALGEIEENQTLWSGRMYQRFILKGFSGGGNFISVSKKTQDDLHKFVLKTPKLSKVVYNGLHQKFVRYDRHTARATFGKVAALNLDNGYILHVGGNTWYKNRIGVVELYEGWRKITNSPCPLILIGAPLSEDILEKVNASKYRADIHCLWNVDDDQLGFAYAGASLFLFPSLGEGFGWPIAEAMASGTLVMTTGEAPMSEVAGQAGYLIPRRPTHVSQVEAWIQDAAKEIEKIMMLSPDEREAAIERGIANAKRFDTDESLNRIEAIYKEVVSTFKNEALSSNQPLK